MKLKAALLLGALLSGCSGNSNDAISSCKAQPEFCWPDAKPFPVSAVPAKPRVILEVMMDDADYNDFGYNSTDAVTPNIDAIASQGVVLSRYYSASAICSPTRSSVMTGKEPASFGLNRLWPDLPSNAKGDYFQGKRGLPQSAPSIAASMGAEGYRSLHIGKWHLGISAERFLPAAKGFDSYELLKGSKTSGSIPVKTEHGPKTVQSEWRAEYEADRIISFLGDNLEGGGDVFVQWWPIEPHVVKKGDDLFYIPNTFDQDAFNEAAGGKQVNFSTNRGMLVAQMFAFDVQLGRVLDFLKAKGVFADSLVIVTSDNGGYQGALSPVRSIGGIKGALSEGGIRVPFAASWPKRIAAGTHSDLPMVSSDILPTLMGLTGGTVPARVDGENMAALLLEGKGRRRPIYFQVRTVAWRKDWDGKADDSFALIDGCDKILQTGSEQLYFDVCKDPFETSDLALKRSERFAQLQALLHQRRLSASIYLSAETVPRARILPADDRLDIHEDDLSVFATVKLDDAAAGGTHTIYRRGKGIEFMLDHGILTVMVRGVGDPTIKPSQSTVRLTAPVPRDNGDHRVGLMIRGYLFGGATIALFVDGQRVAGAEAPINKRLEAGDSLFAVKSEQVAAQLGDDTLPLRAARIYINAIEPDEL